MNELKSKVWWEDVLIRAIRTVAQTLISIIGTASVLSSVDWRLAASSAVVSGLLSVLMSLNTIGTGQGMAQNTTQGTAQGVAQDTARGAPQGEPQDTGEGDPK